MYVQHPTVLMLFFRRVNYKDVSNLASSEAARRSHGNNLPPSQTQFKVDSSALFGCEVQVLHAARSSCFSVEGSSTTVSAARRG